ncbi:hypothetical protein THAOC_09413 [Thalassiosira oceanica]|uniref:Uncharacterized protein n=1 Tax=Thalassiosira oceanica TaxID=159749 RepID=K0TFN7_THAOC|nr:hypothetical protein THAOC_09413 [Thalassiosira oceanica]|eukprot:EJK69337.1 hypothetical protein THAOC_09413 [Thalassiosira oceanica]
MGFILGFAPAPVPESPVVPPAAAAPVAQDSNDNIELVGSKNEPTAAPVARYSNDNIELIGLMHELFNGEGQEEMTTFQGPIVGKQEVLEEFEVEDREAAKGNGPFETSFGPNPCSNDSSDLDADTLNCELDQCGNSDQSLAVDFAYDFYTSPDVTDKLDAVLSDFERRLSKGVARAMGVLDCSDTAVVSLQVARTTTDHIKRRMLRRTLDSRMLISQDVLAIAALPLDSILDADCIPPSSDLDEPFACFPVDGVMTVTIGATGKRYARNLQGNNASDQILAAVKNYIEQGASEYTNNDVLHVKYLGTREDVDDSSASAHPVDNAAASTPQEMNAETAIEIGSSGIGSAGYVGIALVLMSVVLIVSLLVQRRRTRGRRKPRVLAEGDLEEADDIEEIFVDLDSSIDGESQDDAPSSLAVMGGMASGVIQQMSAPSAPASPSQVVDVAKSDDSNAVNNNIEDAPKADESGVEKIEDSGAVALGPSHPMSPSISRDEVPSPPSSPPSSPHQSRVEDDSSDEAWTFREDMFGEGQVPSLSKDDNESSFIGNVDPIAADAGFIGVVDDTAGKAILTERTAVDDVQYV